MLDFLIKTKEVIINYAAFSHKYFKNIIKILTKDIGLVIFSLAVTVTVMVMQGYAAVILFITVIVILSVEYFN